jgi:hypothetical protein
MKKKREAPTLVELNKEQKQRAVGVVEVQFLFGFECVCFI